MSKARRDAPARPSRPAAGDATAAGRGDDLAARVLGVLAGDDALSPRPLTAASIHAALFGETPAAAPTVATVGRTLLDLAGRGLVDGFHEPYSESRYMITRAGRARAAGPVLVDKSPGRQ